MMNEEIVISCLLVEFGGCVDPRMECVVIFSYPTYQYLCCSFQVFVIFHPTYALINRLGYKTLEPGVRKSKKSSNLVENASKFA